MFLLISLSHVKKIGKNFMKILHTVTMATKVVQTTGISVRIFKICNF